MALDRTEYERVHGIWLRIQGSGPIEWLPAWPKPIPPAEIEELLAVLRRAVWPANVSHKNVMPKGVPSITAMALELVKDWKGNCAVICQQTYPQEELCAKLTEWFNVTAFGFLYTSVQCNKNYGAALHIDGNNCGPSAITSMGDHTGGELWVWDDEGDVCFKATKSIEGWCK